jgi:hypothetical protein
MCIYKNKLYKLHDKMCVTWNRLYAFMCIVKLFVVQIQTNKHVCVKSNRFVVQDFSLCVRCACVCRDG